MITPRMRKRLKYLLNFIVFDMPKLPKGKRPPWIPKKVSKPFTGEKFYHSPAWRNLRNKFITENPLCRMCLDNGVINDGGGDKMFVDHIIPIRKGGARLDEANLQTLCRRHHAQKTGKEVHE